MASAVRVKQIGLSWTVRKKQIGKQRESSDNNTNRYPQMAKQPDLQFGYISLRCDVLAHSRANGIDNGFRQVFICAGVSKNLDGFVCIKRPYTHECTLPRHILPRHNGCYPTELGKARQYVASGNRSISL